jgi:hypothetical protein
MKVWLNLQGLLDFAFLVGGDEAMSSVSVGNALFPFFAPGMLE